MSCAFCAGLGGVGGEKIIIKSVIVIKTVSLRGK